MGATVALPLLDAMIPALTAQVRRRRNRSAAWALSTIRTASFTTNGCRRAWAPTSSSRPHTCRTPAVSRQGDRRDGPLHGSGRGAGRRRRRSFPRVRRYLAACTSRNPIPSSRAGFRWTRLRPGVRARDAALVASAANGRQQPRRLVRRRVRCAYSSTISWLTPTLPLMTENNPRVVFERLFGASDSTDPRSARRACVRTAASSML